MAATPHIVREKGVVELDNVGRLRLATVMGPSRQSRTSGLNYSRDGFVWRLITFHPICNTHGYTRS